MASLDFLLSLATGLAIYAIANPFVIFHLLTDKTILTSNLSNTGAMYRAAWDPPTLWRAAQLIAEGASPVFAIAGALAILLRPRRKDPFRNLILILCVPILVQFVAFASNKPAEYARFGLLVDIALMLMTVTFVATFLKQPRHRFAVLTILCAGCAIWSAGYVWHFARDATARPPRLIVADRLQQTHERGAQTIATYSDPAPYCVPPVNLFDWKIVLLDPGAAPPADVDVLIRPIDKIPDRDAPMIGFDVLYWIRPRLLDTPISWASKPFRVLVKRPYAAMDGRG